MTSSRVLVSVCVLLLCTTDRERLCVCVCQFCTQCNTWVLYFVVRYFPAPALLRCPPPPSRWSRNPRKNGFIPKRRRRGNAKKNWFDPTRDDDSNNITTIIISGRRVTLVVSSRSNPPSPVPTALPAVLSEKNVNEMQYDDSGRRSIRPCPRCMKDAGWQRCCYYRLDVVRSAAVAVPSISALYPKTYFLLNVFNLFPNERVLFLS